MEHVVKFDERDHTYTLNGVRVMSVTQVLQQAGLVDTRFFTEYGRHRGSTVHRAIQLLAEGDLDPESIDPKIGGYLDAYERFRAETGFEMKEAERVVCSVSGQFAGTLDQIGKFPGNTMSIIDFKTGTLAPATGLQLTGYASAYQEETSHFVDRLVGVQLMINGRYKLKPYIADFSTWKAALQIAWWKREN